MNIFFIWYWILHTGCIWIQRYSGMPEKHGLEGGTDPCCPCSNSNSISYSLECCTDKTRALLSLPQQGWTNNIYFIQKYWNDYWVFFCTSGPSAKGKGCVSYAQTPRLAGVSPCSPGPCTWVTWGHLGHLGSAGPIVTGTLQCYARNLGIGLESGIHFLASWK